MHDDEELTDEELATFRVALVALRETLQEQLHGADERSGTVHLDQTAVGRISRIDAIQQQQMALAEKRRGALQAKQVDRALKAMDEGSYGECARCGELIARRRLAVRPEAPFCMTCANALGA